MFTTMCPKEQQTSDNLIAEDYCFIIEIFDKFSFSGLVRGCLRLQLHGAIYRPDSFVLMLHYCANLKAIRYESTSLNRIIADKSHSVIVA